MNMSKRQQFNRGIEKIDICVSDIKHDTICVNIMLTVLPTRLACEICLPKIRYSLKIAVLKQQNKEIYIIPTDANNIGF